MPLEQPARVPRVLREHDVGLAQLVEHAQRDVVEVADRRRADRERHVSSAFERDAAPAPISPASAAELGAHDLERLPARRERLAEHGTPRRPATR